MGKLNFKLYFGGGVELNYRHDFVILILQHFVNLVVSISDGAGLKQI